MRAAVKNTLLGAAIAITLAAAFLSGYITVQKNAGAVTEARELFENAAAQGNKDTAAEAAVLDAAIARHNKGLKKFPLNIIAVSLGIGPLPGRAAAPEPER